MVLESVNSRTRVFCRADRKILLSKDTKEIWEQTIQIIGKMYPGEGLKIQSLHGTYVLKMLEFPQACW
jgi:hypothetical protein